MKTSEAQGTHNILTFTLVSEYELLKKQHTELSIHKF